jgi:DNA-binding PadR family transcriptional regulator
VKQLTTTSYAVLGLLSLRPYSAYDLAQQMQRSMHYIWPRAVSAIYTEPKNLEEHGYARSSVQQQGGRSRTVYTITASGRRAFKAWLALDSSPLQLESEALVRLTFADQGSLSAARNIARNMLDDAEALLTRLRLQSRTYDEAAGGGPFPDRMHIVSVTGRFMHEHALMLVRYATWLIEETDGWDSVGPSLAGRGRVLMDELRRDFHGEGPLV